MVRAGEPRVKLVFSDDANGRVRCASRMSPQRDHLDPERGEQFGEPLADRAEAKKEDRFARQQSRGVSERPVGPTSCRALLGECARQLPTEGEHHGERVLGTWVRVHGRAGRKRSPARAESGTHVVPVVTRVAGRREVHPS